MILVVGATGTLGRKLCRSFIEQNIPFRAMSRDQKKLDRFKELGAEVILGDLTDVVSLKAACRGVTKVVAAAHSLFGKGKEKSELVDLKGNQDLIDIARENDIMHFVFISVDGVAPDHNVPFLRMKYQVEEHLKKSGMKYTIIRPTAFLEVHAHLLLGTPIRQKGKTTVFGRGENPRNYVAVDDVKNLILKVMGNQHHHGQTISIGGPENITPLQLVSRYEKVFGKKAKVKHVPRSVLSVFSRLLAPIHPGLSQVMKFSLIADKYLEAYDPNSALPVSSTTLDDWFDRMYGTG